VPTRQSRFRRVIAWLCFQNFFIVLLHYSNWRPPKLALGLSVVGPLATFKKIAPTAKTSNITRRQVRIMHHPLHMLRWENVAKPGICNSDPTKYRN